MSVLNFCTECGWQRIGGAGICQSCGHPFPDALDGHDVSPKSFGLAVALCGVFGLAGIHHFYLGNILHGIFDLGLLIAAIYFFSGEDEAMVLFGMLLFLIDIIHSVVVMIYLFIGKTMDGQGRLVMYPGQRR
jgi:hypothetical protein